MSESRQMPPPSLSVAIVLYHSDLAQLRATLISLAMAAQSLPGTRVYVIDQSGSARYQRDAEAVCASVTESVTQLEVEFVSKPDNGGYGAGHNSVLGRSLGKYHLILNPDVELASSALQQGVAVLEADQDIVMVAPRAVNGDGEEEFLAKRHPSLLVLLVRAFGNSWLRRSFDRQLAVYELRDLPTEGPPAEIPLASGCCMLVRTENLRAIGGFDERFFLYFEDYDLSCRLARHGRLVRDPTMRIVHHGGNAAAKGIRHILWFAAGAVRFFSRWGWRFV